MKIHLIQHEIFEAPGAYLNWARERNFDVTISKVFELDPLPKDAEAFDLLIIMGGPQDPHTSILECPHFDADAEKALIRKAADSGKAIVGVCLGAQLIGDALSGNFDHSPEKEIGIFPIRLTADGLADENISHFGTTLTVGHWHSDMPGLTPESKVLAASDGCPRQIIAYSSIIYGFQCHMELTPEVVELLIAADKEFLDSDHTHRFVQKPEEIRSFDFAEMNRMLYGFLDKLVRSL